jgi:DNA-binding MarR family transcriptional regulator
VACSVLLGASRVGRATEAAAMNGTAQNVKRVFHSTVRVGLVMTSPFGLTPSRFELMFAIKCERQIWYSQRRLRDLLGIAASTVSRMVDALVELGFLERRQDPEDGRCNQLRLTLTGRRAVALTFRTFVKNGFAEYAFGRAMTDSLDGYIAPVDVQDAALHETASALHTTYLNIGKDAYFHYVAKCQPCPVGRIDMDPDFCLWENDELPLLGLLAAVARGTVHLAARLRRGARLELERHARPDARAVYRRRHGSRSVTPS